MFSILDDYVAKLKFVIRGFRCQVFTVVQFPTRTQVSHLPAVVVEQILQNPRNHCRNSHAKQARQHPASISCQSSPQSMQHQNTSPRRPLTPHITNLPHTRTHQGTAGTPPHSTHIHTHTPEGPTEQHNRPHTQHQTPRTRRPPSPKDPKASRAASPPRSV